MFTQKDILNLIIVDDVATAVSAGATIKVYTDLSDGEAAVVNGSNVVLDTTTINTNTDVRVVVRQGTNLYYSPFFLGKNITSYRGKAAVAAVEQVSYLGYNGTSGAMDDTANETYIVRILRQDTQKTFANKEELKFGVYQSASTTYQSEIANGLQKNLVSNFKPHKLAGEQEIKFEVLCNHIGVALGTGTATSATVLATNGSKTISGWADVDDATVNAAMVVGDFLRFGTAVSSPIYKIASIDTVANTLELEVEYQGATALFNDTGLEVIPVASVQAADCGIKFTGIARKFAVGTFKYSKVRFKVMPNDSFSVATVTDSVAALDGTGTYEQVAELEWFCQGNEGNKYRVGTPPPVMIANVANSAYSLLSIDYYQESGESIAGTPKMKKQLIIAFDVTTVGGAIGTTGSDATVGVVTVLDDLAVALGVGTAQVGNL